MNKKNYVLRLCTQCRNIYTIKYGYDYIIGIALVISSSFMLIRSLFEDDLTTLSTQVFLLGYLLMFAAGIILLYGHKKKQQNCTLCNSQKTLIKLDTPQAIEIIKENNISVPEEAQKESTVQSS